MRPSERRRARRQNEERRPSWIEPTPTEEQRLVCESKARYQTFRRAEFAALKNLLGKLKVRHWAYKCPACPGFHLTKTKPWEEK